MSFEFNDGPRKGGRNGEPTQPRPDAPKGQKPAQGVYVVIANECEKVKECVVLTDLERAMDYYRHCREIYGGANVAMCARGLDDVPDNLLRHALNSNFAGTIQE